MRSVEAEYVLMGCAASRRWASAVAAGRPCSSAEDLIGLAERAFDALDRDDWLDTFAGHARIGQPRDGDAVGASEQSGVGGAGADVLDALRRGNEEYEERFGHVFLICASGLDADQMLTALEERLGNPPEVEFVLATAELRKIAVLRLRGIVAS